MRDLEVCFQCGQPIVGGGQIQHEGWCDARPGCDCDWVAYCRPCIAGSQAAGAEAMGISQTANRAERRRARRAMRKQTEAETFDDFLDDMSLEIVEESDDLK